MRSLWADLRTEKLKLLVTLMLCPGAPVTLARAQAALARKVAVGDHRLFLSCTGMGSPTVVMEAGYGDTSDV